MKERAVPIGLDIGALSWVVQRPWVARSGYGKVLDKLSWKGCVE